MSGVLAREIAAQPEAVAALLDRQLAAVRRALAALPPFDYVLLAARGSSDHAALYARYLWGQLAGIVVAPASPSLHTLYRAPLKLAGALAVGISQSGQSPDVVAVLEDARRQGRPTLAITNDAGSPLARAADHVIELGVVERSIAATTTYTCQLAAVALMGVAWSGDEALAGELRRLPFAMAATLADADEPATRAALELRDATTLVTLARGINLATAHEAALKLRELLRLRTEAFSAADFRHGSIALVGDGLPCLLAMPSGPAYADMRALADAVAAGGARPFVVSDEAGVPPGAIRLPHARVPDWLSPAVSILPVQRLALALAHARGLDPDRPRGLADKVVKTM